jgi:hypothetical protein
MSPQDLAKAAEMQLAWERNRIEFLEIEMELGRSMLETAWRVDHAVRAILMECVESTISAVIFLRPRITDAATIEEVTKRLTSLQAHLLMLREDGPVH